MAKEVFDNQDLLRLIYSFGSVEHRIQMYWIVDSLSYPRSRQKDKQFWKCLLSPVPKLMKHHRDWRLYVDFFVYKRCICCSRHSHRKPNIYIQSGTMVFHPGNNTMVPEARDKKDCDCDCRHKCRIIMGGFSNIYD